MRLLLDEMYDRAIAEQLRARGHDVEAVTERPALRALEDAVLLRAAAAEARALVTENSAHFAQLFNEMLAVGDKTFGLILVSPRSMPRNRKTIGLFVRALDAFLASHEEPDALQGRLAWLAPDYPR